MCRRSLRLAPLVGGALMLLACGGQGNRGGTGGAGGSGDCLPPNRLVGDRCLPPGVQDNGCPAGEVGLGDGSCRPAGVPPELCAEGFVHDGDAACEPVLPDEDCPPGQMAIPGETACHPVMDCGAGRWGEIPADATTVYVDQSHAGGDGDGSATQPFTTISDAVASAPTDALIAVAAGTYAEDVLIQKRVRLWGVCPALVAIVGQGGTVGALDIRGAANGTEVVGLAVSSEANPANVSLSQTEDINLERLWIHDGSGRGINVEANGGPTSVTVRHTLVERNRGMGVFVEGAMMTVDGTVIRDTLPNQGDETSGRGIGIQPSPSTGSPSVAALNASVVEGNRDIGIYVSGSEATIEGVVVRDTVPRARDQLGGRGITIRNNGVTDEPSIATLSSSLVERSHDLGIFVGGSTAAVEGLVVRDTLPNQSDQTSGRGINVQTHLSTGAPSTVTLAASLVERSHDLGIYLQGSEATIVGVVVRDTLPRASDQTYGRGIIIQPDLSIGAPSTATLSGTRIERSHDVGIMVTSSAAELIGVVTQETQPRPSDDLFGDGLAVFSDSAPATAALSGCVSEGNARAGLSSFGAHVTLADVRLRCNAFDLAGEPFVGQPFTFTNQGGNLCGCDQATSECKAISAGLEPPEAGGDRP